MPMYEFTLHDLRGEVATQVQEMTDDQAAEAEAYDPLMDPLTQAREGKPVTWISVKKLDDGS